MCLFKIPQHINMLHFPNKHIERRICKIYRQFSRKYLQSVKTKNKKGDRFFISKFLFLSQLSIGRFNH